MSHPPRTTPQYLVNFLLNRSFIEMNRRDLLKSSAKWVAGVGMLPTIPTLMQSCGVERVTDYKPSYLSIERFDMVWQIAELILPKTDSPGASDAGVAPFIDLLFASYFDLEEKKSWENGLETINDEAKKKYSSSFLDLSSKEQLDYLKKLDSDKEPFFKKLKSLILWGFFTSEPGMRSMNYNPVPGRYEGCITIDETEKLLVGNR